MNKIIKVLSLVAVAGAIGVANFFLGVWVFMALWQWFIGIPAFTFAHAFGIMLLIGYLRWDPAWETLKMKLREGLEAKDKDSEKTQEEEGTDKLVKAIGRGLGGLAGRGIFLLVGWIVAQCL